MSTIEGTRSSLSAVSHRCLELYRVDRIGPGPHDCLSHCRLRQIGRNERRYGVDLSSCRWSSWIERRAIKRLRTEPFRRCFCFCLQVVQDVFPVRYSSVHLLSSVVLMLHFRTRTIVSTKLPLQARVRSPTDGFSFRRCRHRFFASNSPSRTGANNLSWLSGILNRVVFAWALSWRHCEGAVLIISGRNLLSSSQSARRGSASLGGKSLIELSTAFELEQNVGHASKEELELIALYAI